MSLCCLCVVITIGIGSVLVLIILILVIIICKRRRTPPTPSNTNKPDRHKKESLTNYYSAVDPASPDVGTLYHSSPIYTASGGLYTTVPEVRNPATSSVYLPMEGNKKTEVDAYVLKETSVDPAYSTAHDAIVLHTLTLPPTPDRQSLHLSRSAASASVELRLSNTSDNGLDVVVDGAAAYADSKLVESYLPKPAMPVHRGRPRMARPRHRPSSVQLVDMEGPYEEIPADYGPLSLRDRQHSSKLKRRPQPPTPVDTEDGVNGVDVGTVSRPQTDLSRSRSRRRCDSADDAVWHSYSDVPRQVGLGTSGGVSLPRPKTAAAVAEEIVKMQRKSSYEEDDTILIESALYG